MTAPFVSAISRFTSLLRGDVTLSLSKGACRRELVEGSLSKGACRRELVEGSLSKGCYSFNEMQLVTQPAPPIFGALLLPWFEVHKTNLPLFIKHRQFLLWYLFHQYFTSLFVVIGAGHLVHTDCPFFNAKCGTHFYEC